MRSVVVYLCAYNLYTHFWSYAHIISIILRL